MYKKFKRCLAGCLTLALALGTLVTGTSSSEVAAASKAKLSKKKITLRVGKTKKVKVKKSAGKKIKWSIKNKKIASIKKSSKKAVKVKGKKKGSTTLICKVKYGKKWKKLKCKVKVKKKQTTLNLASLKTTYSGIFDHIGNVLSYNTSWNNGYQMQQPKTMKFFKQQFNSFTLENEMKPEQLLPASSGTISVSQAKKLGYVIPNDYTEDVVPKLNFDSLDKILEVANKYGIPMRAHTLLWHQQTSTRFFVKDYENGGTSVVSASVMNARLKFYVQTVMKYVMDKEVELTGKAGSIVYAWDVTNEYIHRSNSSTSITWTDVYGDMGLTPTYVKLAYETAYNMLKQYGVENDVTLFYNDYNEYDCADDIISLISYINKDEEATICGGIGMQSHITISYPSIAKYSQALDKFLATGLEVQVTELDIGIESGQTESDQADRYKEIFKLLVSKQKNRDTSVSPKGITGVTIWGLYDSLSWRSSYEPLLFGSSINDPKKAFYSVIEAATE